MSDGSRGLITLETGPTRAKLAGYTNAAFGGTKCPTVYSVITRTLTPDREQF